MWDSQTVATGVNHEFEEYCILKSSPAVSELKCMNTKNDYKQLEYYETLKWYQNFLYSIVKTRVNSVVMSVF